MAPLTQSRLRRSAVGLAVLLPIMMLCAACGTQGEADATSAPPSTAASSASQTAATLPDCSAVWVVGERLPEDYGGCQEGGAAAEDITVPCAIGDVLIEHGDGFYATPGHPVRHAEGGFATDPAYQRVHTNCTG